MPNGQREGVYKPALAEASCGHRGLAKRTRAWQVLFLQTQWEGRKNKNYLCEGAPEKEQDPVREGFSGALLRLQREGRALMQEETRHHQRGDLTEAESGLG